MSTVFLASCLTSTFLLVFLFNFLSSGIYYIPLYIVLHLWLLLITNNFLLLILQSFTFLYVWLLVHHDETGLFPFLILLSLVHTSFFCFNLWSPSICHSSPYNTFTSIFFISSSTLNTTLFLFLALFIFFYYIYLRFLYYYFY